MAAGLTVPTNDLTGNTIATTYDQLLILDDAAGMINSTLRIVSTQTGHSALQITNDQVLIKDASTVDIASVFEVQDKDANVILSVDGVNNAVGIGTATPDSEVSGTVLHIAGTGGGQGVINITGGAAADNSPAGQIQWSLFANKAVRMAAISSAQQGTSDATAGDDAGGSLEFWTAVDNGALTQAMHIDETQNVGIGTAAPSGLLHLYSTTASNPVLYIEHASGGGHGGAITFRNKDDDSVLGNNKEMGTINFQGWDGDSNVTGARIRATVEGTASDAVMPSDLSFWTTTSSGTLTQAMTIGANGKVGIGTTSTSIDLAIAGKSGAACILMINAVTAYDPTIQLAEAGVVKWQVFNDATNDRFYIADASGDGAYLAQDSTATPGWVGTSDLSLKTDISNISDALSKVNQIRGVNFKWKKYKEGAPNCNPITEDNVNGIADERWEKMRKIKDSNNLGVIAQEINEIFPEAVDDTVDGEWGVVYTSLIPVLIEAVKELSAKVTALENA